jgi:hypothetical protein
MSEYTGTFSVQNETGGFITNLVAQHTTSSWPPGTVTEGSLANGGTSGTGQVDTSTSNTDYWTISFTNGVGILIVGSTTCGFESNDNGLNVVIKLYPTYFSVIMPRSSSCNNNSYNSRP